MKSLHNGEGYLMNDNRASSGKLEEKSVLGCEHCQRLLIGDEWRDDGGFCGRCCAPVCGPCADTMLTEGCTPFTKLLDQRLDWLDKNRNELENVLELHGTSGVPPAK